MPEYLKVYLHLFAIEKICSIIVAQQQQIPENLKNALSGLNAETHPHEHSAMKAMIAEFAKSLPNLGSTSNGFQELVEDELGRAIGADYFNRIRSNSPLPKDLMMNYFCGALNGPIQVKYYRNGVKLSVSEIQYPIPGVSG